MTPSPEAIDKVLGQPPVPSIPAQIPLQMIQRLVSLTQARSIRDRAVEELLGAIDEDCQEELQELLDRICRAEPGWNKSLDNLHAEFIRMWDGCGMPYWEAFVVLERTIRYIWTKEREGVQGWALEVVR